MLREIVLDTETTGTDPAGDRIVEIGCVELLNYIPTGRTFHVYVNPQQRLVSQGALQVHGLSDSFLADKPVFAAVAPDFMEFVREARLVIHNAAFDVGFLNAELGRGTSGLRGGPRRLHLVAGAAQHPGASNSLDALCSRYGIDNSRRTKHGALLDAEILAEVYIELIGGKQADLGLAIGRAAAPRGNGAIVAPPRLRPAPRLTDAERAAHVAFVATLGANALWRDYLKDG